MSDPLTNAIKKAQLEYEELSNKEHELRKQRVDHQYKQYTRKKEQQEAFNNLPIGQNIDERAAKLAAENQDYIEHARKSAIFLGMDIFKDKIALFPRNILFIGAKTGGGKSTCVANFTESYLRQGKRVLIITNEEFVTDTLNRIIFLLHNMPYTNHDELTNEQVELCKELYPKIMQKVEVIDDYFNGKGGTTTTLEGLKSIYNTLLEQHKAGEEPYDAILIDYIQNIQTSIEQPNIPQHEVLKQLGGFSDVWKGLYPAPIVMFSQLKPNNAKDGDVDMKQRIEQCKGIMNHATTAIELVEDRANLKTTFKIHKSRFKGSTGLEVPVGFERGRFVPYTQEFMNKVLIKKDKENYSKLLGNVFEEN
jgi:hypothetical protein